MVILSWQTDGIISFCDRDRLIHILIQQHLSFFDLCVHRSLQGGATALGSD
ncbi:hypothetical protein [Nostoc sp.]|uniref:hypothetical protein n=1 Tax=Nostoc sp. TaxID=1180 RepID=UPI002FF7E18F